MNAPQLQSNPATVCIKLKDAAIERKAFYWCYDNFGPQHEWFSTSGWRHNGEYYFFYDEKDAVMFLLRWNGEILWH